MLFGTLSCSRIISASTPPRQKNTKVRTRYMIPIFLWSVVSDPVDPALGRARGRDLVGDHLGNGSEVYSVIAIRA